MAYTPADLEMATRHVREGRERDRCTCGRYHSGSRDQLSDILGRNRTGHDVHDAGFDDRA